MKRLVSVLFAIATVVGCSKTDSGDRFLGEWHRPYPKQSLIVTKEADGKLAFVQRSDSGHSSDPVIGRVVGDAVLFNGVLGTAELRANGSLVFGTWEYVK